MEVNGVIQIIISSYKGTKIRIISTLYQKLTASKHSTKYNKKRDGTQSLTQTFQMRIGEICGKCIKHPPIQCGSPYTRAVDGGSRGDIHNGETDTSVKTARNTDGRQMGEMDIIQKPKQRQRRQRGQLIELEMT